VTSQFENENDRNDREHSTVIISIISGKGGIGKTALALSLAKLLSNLKKRVLLMDVDLATHGMAQHILSRIR